MRIVYIQSRRFFGKKRKTSLGYSTVQQRRRKTATTALLLLAGLYAPHPGYHQTRPLDDGRKICE